MHVDPEWCLNSKDALSHDVLLLLLLLRHEPDVSADRGLLSAARGVHSRHGLL